jgi:hypothetical protein
VNWSVQRKPRWGGAESSNRCGIVRAHLRRTLSRIEDRQQPPAGDRCCGAAGLPDHSGGSELSLHLFRRRSHRPRPECSSAIILDPADRLGSWARGFIRSNPTNPNERTIGGDDLIRVPVTRDISQAVPIAGGFVGTPNDYLDMTVDVSVVSESGGRARIAFRS